LTWHTALVAQGFATVQGFTQLRSRQISVCAHSLSDLQPGSGGGAAGGEGGLDKVQASQKKKLIAIFF
jgi:hypothetical protein